MECEKLKTLERLNYKTVNSKTKMKCHFVPVLASIHTLALKRIRKNVAMNVLSLCHLLQYGLVYFLIFSFF